MSDKDQASTFSELLDRQVKYNSEDKYDIKNFGDAKSPGRLSIKWERIKKTLLGDAGVSNKFVQGAIMGATVGGISGTFFGLLSYFQHRKLIFIPIFALSSALSFGFFMGVGNIIRNDNTSEFVGTAVIEGNRLLIGPPEWQTKYKVN